MTNELTKRAPVELAPTGDREAYALDVSRVVAQTVAVQQCMATVMVDGEHYGVIPGTSKPGEKPKKTLLQPGADKLCLMFRLRPEYEIITRAERDDFIGREVRCRLYHIPTGELWGEGIGSANSREARYKNQAMAKLCPRCHKPAIIRGKPEFGGGWLCYAKKDGCGAKFADGDVQIEGQEGQVNADKLWDLHNTITKMANKRAKVAAVLTATAASDIFTQDMEDLMDLSPDPETKNGGQARPAVKPTAAQPAQSHSRVTVVDTIAAGPTATSPAPSAAPAPEAAPQAQDDEKKRAAKIRALAIAMKENAARLGITNNLEWVVKRIGRTVASRSSLTIAECDKLLAEINGREPGSEG